MTAAASTNGNGAHFDEPHGLFLPEREGDVVLQVHYISVARTAPYRESAGRCFTPQEIPDVEALHKLFGGGHYMVQARGPQKQILGSRTYFLMGEPKSMSAPGSSPSSSEPVQQPTAPHDPYGQQQQRAQGNGDPWPAIIALIQQTSTASAKAQENAATAMVQAVTACASSMVEAVKQSNAQNMEIVTKAFDAVGKLQSTNQPVPDSATHFQTGMEFMSELVGKLRPSPEESGGGGTLGMNANDMMALAHVIAAVKGQPLPGIPGAPGITPEQVKSIADMLSKGGAALPAAAEAAASATSGG